MIRIWILEKCEKNYQDVTSWENNFTFQKWFVIWYGFYASKLIKSCRFDTCCIFCIFCLLIYSIHLLQIRGQTCDGMNEYQACSRYPGCLCFYKAYPSNGAICVDGFSLSCDELVRCEGSYYKCKEPEHECIYHPRCHNDPVCYPVPSYNSQFCVPFSKKNKIRFLISFICVCFLLFI